MGERMRKVLGVRSLVGHAGQRTLRRRVAVTLAPVVAAMAAVAVSALPVSAVVPNNVNQSFIAGGDGPVGVAVDAAHVYWTNLYNGTIGRANLDGTGANQSLITGADGAFGIAVDSAHIYWANLSTRAIARANLDGSGVNYSFIPTAYAIQVAVDATHIYWTNNANDTIGRANLDGSNVNTALISDIDLPAGIAVNAAHIYWTNYRTGAIGRANLDGTGVNQSFITGALRPAGMAVDAGHLYWSDADNNAIGRANLDGTGVNQSFITGADSPFGVAVDAAHLYWANSGGSLNSVGRAGLLNTPTIFEVELKACANLHVGYNYFPANTVVHWNLSQAGVKVVSGQQFTTLGGGRTYHFLTMPLGVSLQPEAMAGEPTVRFSWTINGVLSSYVVRRDPGC
jgi:virginiamycin B lyase